MLRLALGYHKEGREVDPVVLACTHDAVAAQKAIDDSDPSFVRLELATITHNFRARRRKGAHPAPPAVQSTHTKTRSVAEGAQSPSVATAQGDLAPAAPVALTGAGAADPGEEPADDLTAGSVIAPEGEGPEPLSPGEPSADSSPRRKSRS